MAIGIICEYNPFHKGHLYHLTQARQNTDEPIICVMSGHYVQRGEPAMFDKWSRTRMALAAGADMVLELPTYYSSATAEWFAYGAASLLARSGLVTTLSFGMETPDLLPTLQALTAHLAPETPAYQALLQQGLAQLLPFAQARQQALETLAGTPLPLTQPNNILVLEYLRALRRLNWSPQLLPIQRPSGSYHDLSLSVALPSASALRRAAAKGLDIRPYLPPASAAFLPNTYVSPAEFFAPLGYAISRHTPVSLRCIAEVTEGLENRILEAANHTTSYETLLQALQTKRYPTSRLRRILLNILLDITEARKTDVSFSQGPGYLRVLGFRRTSQHLLSELTRSASLPVVTNLARQLPVLSSAARAMLEDEIRFSRIYAACCQNLHRDSEYRQGLCTL